jgi:hypothetical protein
MKIVLVSVEVWTFIQRAPVTAYSFQGRVTSSLRFYFLCNIVPCLYRLFGDSMVELAFILLFSVYLLPLLISLAKLVLCNTLIPNSAYFLII